MNNKWNDETTQIFWHDVKKTKKKTNVLLTTDNQ